MQFFRRPIPARCLRFGSFAALCDGPSRTLGPGAGRDRDEDFAQARGTGTRDGENIPYLRLLRPIVPRGILSIEHRDEPKS